MSRTPTVWPWRESVRASWVVILDLPTPPLPERTSTICRISDWTIVIEATQSGAAGRGDWEATIENQKDIIVVGRCMNDFKA